MYQNLWLHLTLQIWLNYVQTSLRVWRFSSQTVLAALCISSVLFQALCKLWQGKLSVAVRLALILKRPPFTQPAFIHQQRGCAPKEIISAIATSQKLPAWPHVIGEKEPHIAAWWPRDATLNILLCLPPQRSLMLPWGQAVGGGGGYAAARTRATHQAP